MPLAGQRVLAADFTAAQSDDDNTTQSNITATSGSPSLGSPGVNVTFTAPTSGKALVTVGMRCRDDGAVSTVVLDWRLREDNASGTIILNHGNQARRLEMSHAISGSYTRNWDRSYLATGLTAGQVYYVELVHWCTPTGSADILQRNLTVLPLPA